MNVVIAGGTGFIGRALSAALAAAGHRITVLSRSARRSVVPLIPNIAVEPWDAEHHGGWDRVVEEAHAVVNLCGAPIADARWTTERKRLLVESRIDPTRLLVESLARTSRPPLLINASGVGFYGPWDETPVNESTPAGTGFLAELSVAWESAALQAEQYGAHVVLLRLGMVLDRTGGALPRMLVPFRVFMGGPIAPGNQWVSWIHLQDVIGLVQHVLAHPALAGPVNAVAPAPVTMREFCRTLGIVLHRPSWLPVPETALRIALGELGTVLTTGQRAEPKVAIQSGYAFRFPTLQLALQSILQGPDAPSERPDGRAVHHRLE